MTMTQQEIQKMFERVDVLTKPSTTRNEKNIFDYIKKEYKLDNNIFTYTIVEKQNGQEVEVTLADKFCKELIAEKTLDFALKHNAKINPSMLQYTLANNNIGYADKLICEANLDINTTDANGNTPLHLANNKDVVECLMNHNASFSIKNNEKKTAIETITNENALRALHKNISKMQKRKLSKVIALVVVGTSIMVTSSFIIHLGASATLGATSNVYNFFRSLFVKALGAGNAKFFTPFLFATSAIVGISGLGLVAVGVKKEDKIGEYAEALNKIDNKLAQFQAK